LRQIDTSTKLGFNPAMPLDLDRIDEATLALLYLSLHDERRAWKSFDWDATDRLYAKGLLDNPRNKNKSVVLTDEGLAAAKAACVRLFGKDD
jgi:hypothetical protein